MNSTPPADTSTAGGWTWEKVHDLLLCSHAPHPNYELVAKEINASLAALREQLEREIAKGMGLLKTIAFCNDQIVKRDAALKQKDEAMDYAAAELQQHMPMSHAITVLDEASRIQPGSTALKTFIEAETAKLRELLKVARCPECDGSGAVQVQTRRREYVTREMAMDAGAPSMEGSLYSDDEYDVQQCQWCDERNAALAASAQKAGQQQSGDADGG